MSAILIDVGNTSTTIGRWENDKVTEIVAVKGGIKDPSKVATALEELRAKECSGAMLASVVPAVNDTWRWMLESVVGIELDILSVSKHKLPIGIKYPNPEQIGADRIADAVGAVVRYGHPVIVADFGTALTFDVVDNECNYIGGAIAPGLPLMTEYLHERTAKLPLVTLDDDFPNKGDSTENAMKLGAKLGHRGMVREISTFLRDEVLKNKNAVLCATGGYAEWALDGLDMDCHIDYDLTLFGLGVIYVQNK
ncbi:MAG: type III pantothenate kinase [Kiritimatiellae bacterium]|nr:type III pantothenate kinase [Kiritimatiellia bacterium]